ncbi:hypothetical protein [Bacterioplanoides sp. SCSIO 12839]|uniref:hypothetical protein n=1 Tax=Bacterioplanoides sp. SCSIO 12839 TaxID=2829569 RepID=UPI002106CEF2|nr:hypothetical protein [Bacterioplanoides sp. SCSIO 12839]UTW47284.1 hypothetical protein KFF03_11895 [Bacterioplanoides sp. SCSIO 12839]
MKEVKPSLSLSLILLAWGLFMISEGLQITTWGKASPGTPQWVVTVAGFVIVIAGVMTLIKDKHSKWNDLLAALFCSAMGSVGGWIALFVDESQISGSGKLMTSITGLPTGKIAFGIGAVICFWMAAYALTLFYKKGQNNLPK